MAKYKIIPSSRTIVQSPISIGHKAEKGVEAIEFDLTAWVETYGSGTATIVMKRWGDSIPYPVALEIDENNKATWTLSDIDTAKAGMAYAQLNYIVGDEVVKKSDIYTFRVMDSLTGEGEPPEAYESWLEHLTHIAAEAMAEVLDIEDIVTDKTLTVDGGIADGKATGDALALKADKSTTYTKSEVDQMIEDVEVETDTTLSVSGAPADAKKTGDALSALEDQFGEETDKLKADLTYNINGSTLLLELGNITFIPDAEPLYGVSTTRVRTQEARNVDLKKGSKIIVTNPDIVFYVIYYSNVQSKWVGYGWLSNEYTLPENASCALLFRYNPEGGISDIASISDYIRISTTISAEKTINDIIDLCELTYDEFEGYIGADGSLTVPTTREEVFTDLIGCSEGDVIYWQMDNPNANPVWGAYGAYDINANFITRVVTVPNGTMVKCGGYITVPTGASYIRFSYRTYGGAIKLILRSNSRRNNTYQYKLERAFTKVEHLIPMIPSLFLGLPRFDTVAKTLTIPRDTLLMFHECVQIGTIFVSMPETIVDFSSITSSAIKFYFNIDSKTVRATAYNGVGYDNEVLLCSLRVLPNGGHASMSIPYYIDGKLYGFDFNELVDKDLSSFNKNVKSVNHRGYNTVAPENTLPAYQLSKKNGFNMVETDVSFTSDNVAVLLHDNTINRTARNSDGTEISETTSINSITYAEALTYDFGIWKGSAYEGTKIPTFEQFISLCRKIGLHPYIELKSAGVTQSNVQSLVDIVKSYNMHDKVTWISFNVTFLGYVKQYDSTARLGVVCGEVTESIITNAVNLKTQDNDVFIDASGGTDNDVSLAKTAGLQIEVWGVNTANSLNALDGYVSGATTDKLIFGYELYKANVQLQ